MSMVGTTVESLNPKPRTQLSHRNVQRFRSGLVFKAHRLCVSLNSRLKSNEEEEETVIGRPFASGQGATRMGLKTSELKMAQVKTRIWP